MAAAAAFLKALTPEARVSLRRPQIQIPCFPFRVGRESRSGSVPKAPDSLSISRSDSNNDLNLIDKGPPMNVSREHFRIEMRDGQFYLVDRGSLCGTLVEGVPVGTNRAGGERRLENGDVIIVGTSMSPYVFKFVATT